MRMRLARPGSNYSDEENPYWISFSDIMSGLLVIFILATLALILDLMQTRTQVSEAILELAKAEQVRKDILQEIEFELRKKNIQVEISDNDTVLRIPEGLLTFRSNRYVIPDDMQGTVEEIGKVLYESISRDTRWLYLDTIFIEGHTDIWPANKFEGGNWELSTKRAISVWQYWQNNLSNEMSLEALRNHSDSPLFSVGGYGETRPITAQQLSAEDRSKNRRIDIRFTVRKPSSLELKKINRMIAAE